MTDDEVIGPMLFAMKRTIEEEGGANNMVAYLRDDKHLLTVQFGLDRDRRIAMVRALGEVGRSLGATTLIVIMDTFVRTLTPGESIDRPPSEDPQSTEALMISQYDTHGVTKATMVQYRRNDDGSIAWSEPNDMPGTSGPINEAFALGFAGARGHGGKAFIRAVKRTASFGTPVFLIPLDEQVVHDLEKGPFGEQD